MGSTPSQNLASLYHVQRETGSIRVPRPIAVVPLGGGREGAALIMEYIKLCRASPATQRKVQQRVMPSCDDFENLWSLPRLHRCSMIRVVCSFRVLGGFLNYGCKRLRGGCLRRLWNKIKLDSSNGSAPASLRLATKLCGVEYSAGQFGVFSTR